MRRSRPRPAWPPAGSNAAASTSRSTPERMMVLRKQLALARSFGVECEEISPARAGELFPVMRTDDLQGAIWIPGDGKANPADLTMSLAKGARKRGVQHRRGRRSHRRATQANASGSAVTGVRVRHGGEEREVALRDRRQLRRPVGAPVRRARRRQRAALVGRALLHRHRPHRGRAPDAAGDARPRRLHLLQGGGRRPA